MSNNSIRAGFDTERSRAGAFSGSFQTLGSPLTENPVILIIDNQSSVSVELSVDGTNTWKTFSSGEALVLDLRGNNGIASNFTVDIGTQFYVKGTGGTGSFRISILYAR
jgi:hypothetical protein